jgi:hypothetical protein
LYSAQVVAPIVRKLPRERRLQQVRRVARARRTTGADQGVRFVDEEDDGALGGIHLVDDLAQAAFEFALHARAGLQQADVERAQFHLAKRGRYIAFGDAPGEAFHHRRLADAGFAHQHGIVLPPAHEDVDDLPDLLVAADHGIDLAGARLFREVDRVTLQAVAFSQCGRGRLASLAVGLPIEAETIVGAETILRRAGDDARQVVDKGLRADLVEFRRDAGKHVPQAPRSHEGGDQVSRAHLRFTEAQRRIHPGALDGFLDIGRQIAHRRGPARQAFE